MTGILELVEQYIASNIAPLTTGAAETTLAELKEVRDTASSPWEAYTKYYNVLEGIFGRPAFDLVIQHAVRTAYTTPKQDPLVPFLRRSPWGRLDNFAAAMEQTNEPWRLPKGIDYLGRILTERPTAFGEQVLTTNFDPLIEVAVARHGGRCSSQSYKTDGTFDSLITEGSTINVRHLHGFWRSNQGDNRSLLNSPEDLTKQRLVLSSSIADLVRETLVVVVGYGAWDDVFTGALSNLRTARQYEVLWAFYSDDNAELERASTSLTTKIGDTQSIVFYKGVDSNVLFPDLYDSLSPAKSPRPKASPLPVPERPQTLKVTVPEVLPIGDRGITQERYGPKAATLSRLKRNGVNVPDGYCIDLAKSSVDEMQKNGELRRIWDSLEGGPVRTDTEPIMVRSSASVEDSTSALFPGRFASRKDVRTFTDLIVGVSACERSPDDPAVKEYREALGLDIGKIRMGAIVQRQITAKLAGVAFTSAPEPYGEHDMLIELTEGAADQLLLGESTGSLYSVVEGEGFDSYAHLSGPHLDTALITLVLSRLSAECRRVAQLLGAPQDIEWVWDGELLYIVQARPIRTPSVDAGLPITSPLADQVHRGLPSLPMADAWGLKAAAAQYFRRLNWGAANATVVPPHTDASDVATILGNRIAGPRGTVIRFSVEAHVGVAKRFVAPGGDILRAFLETRQDAAWVGIVSDYVFVESAFEAYVSDRSLLVEHVPGNWEPDNQLPPDVFLWTESRFEFMRVASPRVAAVEVPSGRTAPGVLRKSVRPLDDDVATEWAQHMISCFSTIRADLAPDLPVNVHFVSDSAGRWYFLNIRPTTHLNLQRSERLRSDTFKANRFFLVVSPLDIGHWDRQARILINCAADRGGLRRISAVARSLLDAGVSEVYCTFGVLSHPAILLREFGLNVVPLYVDHEVRDIGDLRW